MTNLRQDIQFGFRMLLKSRGLAAIAIFALAQLPQFGAT